jgi:hypothetical protein
VVEHPQISLYCLDEKNRQAIFAELSPGVDLVQAPFYYQAQFDHAQRLIAVPYEQLPYLADLLPGAPERLILIHNIGRCGSTLLHHVLNQVEGVISLSEPDVLTQFVSLHSIYHQRQAELIELLRYCVRFISKPALYSRPASTYALKFRNQCIEIIDLLYQAFPQAHHLFLYRSAEGWVSSLYGLVSRHSAPPEEIPLTEAIQQWSDYTGRPISPAALGIGFQSETLSLAEYATVAWLIMIDRYLAFYQAGCTMPALRYEELKTHQARSLAAIFEDCHLPAAAIPQALAAFTKDSQEGTRLARTNPEEGSPYTLTETQKAQIRAILNQYQKLQAPAFILPGTHLIA